MSKNEEGQNLLFALTCMEFFCHGITQGLAAQHDMGSGLS